MTKSFEETTFSPEINIERQDFIASELAKRAVPPVIEWGPARNRDDFQEIHIEAPDLSYSA